MTILNEMTYHAEVISRHFNCWSVKGVLSILGILLLIALEVFLIWASFNDLYNNDAFFVASMLVLVLIAICIFAFIDANTTLEYRDLPQYEVIIDDDTNFKEFYEKYDIVEQRGDIYVIRERIQPED